MTDRDGEVSLSAAETRVLGSLIEKAMTTPDHYPMTLNGVVTACNQVSNRDPVVSYDDGLVERTLRGLADNGLAKLVHRPGDRVVKYRQALQEVLGLSAHEAALLAVLMLRDAQTPGELRQRTGRYTDFVSLTQLEETLHAMGQRSPGLVVRLERRPGQKEYRYRQLLTSEEPLGAGQPGATPVPAGAPIHDEMAKGQVIIEQDEMAELRARLAVVEARVEELLQELGLEA